MGLLDGSYSICKQSAPRSRQITTLTPHHSIYTTYLHKIYTGRMLFLTPNQQCQSTKGRLTKRTWKIKIGRNKPHLVYAHSHCTAHAMQQNGQKQLTKYCTATLRSSNAVRASNIKQNECDINASFSINFILLYFVADAWTYRNKIE